MTVYYDENYFDCAVFLCEPVPEEVVITAGFYIPRYIFKDTVILRGILIRLLLAPFVVRGIVIAVKRIPLLGTLLRKFSVKSIYRGKVIHKTSDTFLLDGIMYKNVVIRKPLKGALKRQYSKKINLHGTTEDIPKQILDTLDLLDTLE